MEIDRTTEETMKRKAILGLGLSTLVDPLLALGGCLKLPVYDSRRGQARRLNTLFLVQLPGRRSRRHQKLGVS